MTMQETAAIHPQSTGRSGPNCALRAQGRRQPPPRSDLKLAKRESKVSDPPSPTTVLLRRIGDGDQSAENELYPRVMQQLLAIAEARLGQDKFSHTLAPACLVNEVFLKLSAASMVFHNRAHFIATAAMAIRQILVDYSRRKPDPGKRVPIDALADSMSEHFASRVIDAIAVDEALDTLALEDADAAGLIVMRFFGGQPLAECARVLGMKLRTAYRKEQWARVRLYQIIGPTTNTP